MLLCPQLCPHHPQFPLQPLGGWVAGMRTHFFPPICGFLGEQPAAHRGHRGSSCHLWPCEIGQQNSPDAAPYFPVLLGFSTDQSCSAGRGTHCQGQLPSTWAGCSAHEAVPPLWSAQHSLGGFPSLKRDTELNTWLQEQKHLACSWREGTATLCRGKSPLSNPPELSEGTSIPR